MYSFAKILDHSRRLLPYNKVNLTLLIKLTNSKRVNVEQKLRAKWSPFTTRANSKMAMYLIVVEHAESQSNLHLESDKSSKAGMRVLWWWSMVKLGSAFCSIYEKWQFRNFIPKVKCGPIKSRYTDNQTRIWLWSARNRAHSSKCNSYFRCWIALGWNFELF